MSLNATKFLRCYKETALYERQHDLRDGKACASTHILQVVG